MKGYRFDEHGKGYAVGKTLQSYRPQFSILLSLIPKQSKVLDVACGDGVLGEKLIKENNCSVFGIDLDAIGVKESRRKGIKAKQWDANQKFPYPSKSFDVVVCNDSLECMENPNIVVSEMFRVSKNTVIVTFPNFGFWVYRIQMLFGIFPYLSLFGHKWWNTRMIKFFSLKDFLQLPVLKGKKPQKIICINWRNRKISQLSKLFPNLFARSCILIYTTIPSSP